jgi:transmembrane sensor
MSGQTLGPGELLLAAGEQSEITLRGVGSARAANLAVVTAWTERRLVFESTPLEEVIEEFNRYNEEQLVIEDPLLRDYHITGVFLSTDSRRMVEFLRRRFDISTRQTGDRIEISRRADP